MSIIKTKDKRVKNKILLIDDEIDACLIFKNMLEENRFDTNAYDKPLDALHNFKSGIYDLVVLDIKMPKIDKRIKVCFITAPEDYYIKQFPELKEEECFMQKPISTDSFVSRIKLALAN